MCSQHLRFFLNGESTDTSPAPTESVALWVVIVAKLVGVFKSVDSVSL